MATPQIQNVYIRLAANHQLELFTDAAATIPMVNESPVAARGDGKGKFQFNFILNHNPGHHNGHIETADLIIIPHTLDELDANGRLQRKKDSAFEPPNKKAHVIDDPGELLPNPDPGNLGGTVPKEGPAGGIQWVVAGQLDIRKVGSHSGPYKYTIAAISDSGEDFDAVDPTIKLEP